MRITPVRSVNIAELKDRLSVYITFARSGEEIIIRDRNLPVAKLVPFLAGDASDEEMVLVAAGKMTLPEKSLDFEELWKIKMPKVSARLAIDALIQDREESL